jgi:membrane protease YdiL (CAAX protease family)
MDVLKDLSSAPLPLLLLIIAVAPALGEELMFRGLIGRGLVARWGVVRGVLLTSLLFGIVHIHPAHALGVIPLGIAMHFVYLTTRSFWAPVLLHFLNNAWATTVTKYSAELEGTELMADNAGLPPQVLVQSLVVTVAISMLLWHTRVR